MFGEPLAQVGYRLYDPGVGTDDNNTVPGVEFLAAGGYAGATVTGEVRDQHTLVGKAGYVFEPCPSVDQCGAGVQSEACGRLRVAVGRPGPVDHY